MKTGFDSHGFVGMKSGMRGGFCISRFWQMLGRCCRTAVYSLGIGLFGAVVVGSEYGHAAGHDEAPMCRSLTFEGVSYITCAIDPAHYRIRLHWQDEAGVPYASLEAVYRAMEANGNKPLLLMNGGMYEEDLSPVGLFIQHGRVLHPASTRQGPGNFHMKPNGVFFVQGKKAGVLETSVYLERFPIRWNHLIDQNSLKTKNRRSFADPIGSANDLKTQRKVDIATQSGPMLVLNGKIHPRFKVDGESRKIRNGVGIRRDGTVMFVISQGTVSFGRFARLFRDKLECNDALYLDGTVSRLMYDGEVVPTAMSLTAALTGAARQLGPIISISEK